MSSLPEREQKLIFRLWSKQLREEEFFKQFPVDPGKANTLGIAMLRRALLEHDGDAVEFGLYLRHRFGIPAEYLPEYFDMLLVLAEEDWHHSHEDVASALSELRAPKSVDVLARTALAQYAYLDFDEAYALGVKCIWAPGNIQTQEAVARLGELLHCGNSILEINSLEQLTRIEDTGQSEDIRAAAHKALGGRPSSS